jgi:hypothetical protein
MAATEGVTTTYEQLQQMTPAERTAHFKASVVRDPAQLPERYRARLDAQADRVLEREERLRGTAS